MGIYCFGATLGSNHWVPLLTAVLCPAGSYSRAVWTFHSILSSSGVWFHSFPLNFICIFLPVSLAPRWGHRVEMSLNMLWFGNSDDCKWHWASSILLVFLILANSRKWGYWIQNNFKQVNNSFSHAKNEVQKLTLSRMWQNTWHVRYKDQSHLSNHVS